MLIKEPIKITGQSLYQDVVTYAQMGDHRTATEVDTKTAQWIRDELKKAGFTTELQTFDIPQYFIKEKSLTVSGKQVDCFPLWPVKSTGYETIKALLVKMQKGADQDNLKGSIALVTFPRAWGYLTLGKDHIDLIGDAAKAGAKAVIAVQEAPSPEIWAINVKLNEKEQPIPVIQVSPKDEKTLLLAIEKSEEVSLKLNVTFEAKAKTQNVIGKIGNGQKCIVVSTPTSGWFQSGGERGPGVSLFLNLARWVGQKQHNVSFIFVATSGHERFYVGMDRYMENLAPKPENVATWLHLGASIGTWSWKQTPDSMEKVPREPKEQSLVCSPQLLSTLQTSFADAKSFIPTSNGNNAGEVDGILKKGYNAFGIFNGHMYFHTPADGPENTAPELLEPIFVSLTKTFDAVEADFIGK
ncbi:hypothetical protein [Desulfosporosinus metallidurans]|uniref:PA domain-containing protein n=1 Tax=Desulfosporosinus metallidurans TaxID=1888891 RepID=A0A1Q8QI12_9FIRM|nr:hypothetical protein [Desulfosporosinus metallidurans]OLN26955.1 hypothetical protein DSOL_4774 [Desulfosporosinus metallidurans]